MKKTLSLILLVLISGSFAQDGESTLAEAQKSYVSGNWKEAAAAYEKACPLQPKEKQPECLLWNVLALSQTGEAASFKKAGKRLDSLIQKVNPQEDIYADLMMTSAQFRLYLGKYDKAAEELIHAIETSKPHHNVVLQKVCGAVKAKIHSGELTERCESLKAPQPAEPAKQAEATQTAAEPATQAATQPAAQTETQTETPPAEPLKKSQVELQPSGGVTSVPATVEKTAGSAEKSASVEVSAAKTVSEKPATVHATVAATPVEKQAVSSESTPVEPAKQAVPAPVVKAENAGTSESYWVLQLGAFGVKSNADILVSNLKKRSIKANIVEQIRGEKTLYLVQTGRFSSREEAVDFGAKQLSPLNVEFQPLVRK
ncbi:MAG: SPOR domain-containing protein [Fibrobacter sp.]|nr:SPOR domain-containing protein [Fibrobacter sp.]